MARVALVHNLIPPEMLRCGPVDRSAELDCDETIKALVEALSSRGHQVIPIDANERISESLKQALGCH